MSGFATTGSVANIRLSSVHTAGLKEWQDGLLGACCLHVVELHVWAALHQPEAGMLEEMRSELVASILGRQLAGADEAATHNLPGNRQHIQYACQLTTLSCNLSEL